MTDTIQERMRAAFDSDDIAEKNLALRAGHDHIDALESKLQEAVEALEEAQELAIKANEALLVQAVVGQVPTTAYNHERDQRRAYIDRIGATLAKLKP